MSCQGGVTCHSAALLHPQAVVQCNENVMGTLLTAGVETSGNTGAQLWPPGEAGCTLKVK